MANVFDVARYILEETGQVTTLKLQKLVYYCQAWSLAWEDQALFDDKVRAWKEGPVVGTLYHVHRGWLSIDAGNFQEGASANLSDPQREIIRAVLGFYGRLAPEDLSKRTHQESPWLNARGVAAPGDHGNEEITREAMRSFYIGLAGTADAPPSPGLLRHLSEGIEDARAGRTVSRGSFAQYLED